MKRIVGLTVIVLLISFSINAQQKQERKHKGSDFTTEQNATLMTKKMTLKLDLDENQQKEIFTLMKQNMSERKAKMTEFKKQKETGTEFTSEQRFEMQNSRLDKQIQHKTAMKTILSKDQFEQWEKTMKTRKRNGNRKGMKNGDRKNRQHKNRK
jgi:hypothetical protein